MDVMVKTDFLDRMMARGLTVWESRVLGAIMAQGIVDGGMDNILLDAKILNERIKKQLEAAGEVPPAGINVQISNAIPKLIEKGFLTSSGKQGRKYVASVVSMKADI